MFSFPFLPNNMLNIRWTHEAGRTPAKEDGVHGLHAETLGAGPPLPDQTADHPLVVHPVHHVFVKVAIRAPRLTVGPVNVHIGAVYARLICYAATF